MTGWFFFLLLSLYVGIDGVVLVVLVCFEGGLYAEMGGVRLFLFALLSGIDRALLFFFVCVLCICWNQIFLVLSIRFPQVLNPTINKSTNSVAI